MLCSEKQGKFLALTTVLYFVKVTNIHYDGSSSTGLVNWIYILIDTVSREIMVEVYIQV